MTTCTQAGTTERVGGLEVDVGELSLILPASPSRQLQSSYTARRVGARSAALTLELGHHQMRLFGILMRPEKI
jgi:hypothetical protein